MKNAKPDTVKKVMIGLVFVLVQLELIALEAGVELTVAKSVLVSVVVVVVAVVVRSNN